MSHTDGDSIAHALSPSLTNTHVIACVRVSVCLSRVRLLQRFD